MKQPPSKFSVIIIDDHPLFLKGSQQLIGKDPRFVITGTADNNSSGLALVLSLQPDVVLLDLNLGEDSGLSLLTQLKQSAFSGRIVILTVSADMDDICNALTMGADGYLLKSMPPEALLEKLYICASTRPVAVLDEEVASLLVKKMRMDQVQAPLCKVHFSQRESQVVRHIAAGKSNKLIARALNISDGTVKVHVKNILRKLNLSSRLEAAIWAVDNGY